MVFAECAGFANRVCLLAKALGAKGVNKGIGGEVLFQELMVLEEVGNKDKMNAIGLFEHFGVAGHSDDKGMVAIAERLLPYLSGEK